jgi:hypothetical protein
MSVSPDAGDGSLRRIARLMAVLAALGAVAWMVARGVPGVVSFVAGAAVSGLSFWWLQRIVRGMEEAAKSGRVRGASAVVHSFRILLLGGVLYGILRVYEVILPALVTGLLVAVTAITLEALYEWKNGTTP